MARVHFTFFGSTKRIPNTIEQEVVDIADQFSALVKPETFNQETSFTTTYNIPFASVSFTGDIDANPTTPGDESLADIYRFINKVVPHWNFVRVSTSVINDENAGVIITRHTIPTIRAYTINGTTIYESTSHDISSYGTGDVDE